MLRLKEIRVEKGLTQNDLAKILDVSPQAVGRYEAGKRQLDPEQIIKLSLALEVTPNDLLGFEEAYKKYTEYLKSLLDDEEEQ